ncbi:glycosyl hydrolase family 38 protein [Nitzschia inconspicua]|uniref:Glycosyl hydrolase family 38 protein n=1 Tax=Nitzschia inconspicua TaxID=303405 RepID=A0A9K3M4E0_9STRA|nr:glycosyl hydrolase family 38 protein [Nitzschia inconspicua]KAG7372816.1 glycosyl hydrolase family 38 protein [Nitzschia inconspicua]
MTSKVPSIAVCHVGSIVLFCVLLLPFFLTAFWKQTFLLHHDHNHNHDDTDMTTDIKPTTIVVPPLVVPFPVQKYAAVFPTNSSSNNNSNNNHFKTLNIHVVAHTHDDVGWLKTVEQYFHGWNQSIQHVCVDDILTTVVEALVENPHRTFTYVEQKFFGMWWDRQTDEMKRTVRQLVHNQQLTFVNGGWCMHDEATTHYIGMIDQTTLGHDFLKKEFNVIPKVGWQLDPFGHSSTQASLLTYRMGLDALYFGRIDYQDLSQRHATQECEGLWNASTSWKDSTVFWGLTGSYGGNYGPPTGFCFDVHCDADFRPLLPLNRSALIRSLEDFLMQVRQQSDRTKGRHVMLTMGSDFQYQRAGINFANTDYLIGTIMHLQQWQTNNELDISAIFGPRFDRVNIFYSSPDYYTECKYNETIIHSQSKSQGRSPDNHVSQTVAASIRSLRSLVAEDNNNSIDTATAATTTKEDDDEIPISWTVKQDDFFPYSDCPHCFWTGYFTSRPALKKLERVSSAFLMAARQMESLLDYDGRMDKNSRWRGSLHELEDASGVVQHHDGVSGTSKQHVANDYAKRLQAGIDAVAPLMIQKIKRRLLGTKADSFLKNLSFCQLLNETKCDVSTTATTPSNAPTSDLFVVVYNSLAWKRNAYVQLPVSTGGYYEIHQLDNSDDESTTTLPSILAQPSSNGTDNGAPFLIKFNADDLPPLGATVYQIRKKDAPKNTVREEDSHSKVTTENEYPLLLNITTGHFVATINTRTGQIVRLGSRAVENLTTWGYYTSFDGKQDSRQDNDHQNSGAYIFRPSTPNQKLQVVSAVKGRVVNSTTGIEVHVTYSEPWIKTTTRFLKDVSYVEMEYQVGPIPASDRRGKEVVVRYNTMVDNQATFYTDSNGREFVKRQRNHRPTWDVTVYEPIAGNYYPVNTAIFVEDPTSAFAIVTDRSQGGTSMTDGTLEIMVHRRTVVDDWRGVSEAINETDGGMTPYPPWGNATRLGDGIVIRGTHRILLESSGSAEDDNDEIPELGGAALARSVMDESFAEPLVFVASATSSKEGIPFIATSFSGLNECLPKNVMLLTKQLLHDEEPTTTTTTTTYLIRLGHQYGVDEDGGKNNNLSRPVTISLDSLFPEQTIAKVEETTLSGNRDISVWRSERMEWTPTSSSFPNDDDKQAVNGSANNSITIQPMDIRTFKVLVK